MSWLTRHPIFRRLALILPLGLSVFGVLPWLARGWRIGDNITSFTAYMALVAIGVTVLFAVLRHWTGFAAMVVVLGLFAIQCWRSTSPAPAAEAEFTIVSSNVKTANTNYQQAAKAFRDRSADILVLLEVDTNWEIGLEELSDIYPHAVWHPQYDNFGVAVLSRFPILESDIIEQTSHMPMIRAEIEIKGRQVVLYAVHPLPPTNPGAFRRRNGQLADLAERVRNEEHPTIVAGDLNVAPWSPHFQDFRSQSGLRDARRRFDHVGTWPATVPFPRARIDHILISPTLGMSSAGVAPALGSDHLPVQASLGWR